MGQEFFVKSDTLEDKVRQILPSQGGLGQGFDLSASTTIVPIVDLTESAEGSQVRQDLQTALSFDTVTVFNVQGAITNTDVITNTGYYRVFGVTNLQDGTNANFSLFDGATNKKLFEYGGATGVTNSFYDFIVYLRAGDKLQASALVGSNLQGVTRQIADIDGNLV